MKLGQKKGGFTYYMEKEFETCGGSIETVGFWWVAGLTPGWALGPSIGPQTVGRVPIFSFKFH